MQEDQNIEWKQSWRDEDLNWICGFANADGGVLEIGKDDEGKVVGAEKAKKLLEDLPNKIRDILGILVDVNLHSDKGLDWLSIHVDSYPFPISYKGQFHYRTGSTKQELKGAALNKFLLKKQGKSWDGITVPQASIDNLSGDAFKYFKSQAIRTNRLDPSINELSREELLENLHLLEEGQLKRATLLLFHEDLEKFFTGAYIKIGYFRSEADLRFQDVVNGSIFEQVEKTLDLLHTKYLEAQIRYEGIHRVEEFPYPKEAFREAILNAVAHKDYSTGIPIQIKVYRERISIWNAGALQDPITIQSLAGPHPSVPYNPSIASTLFRAGLIESWGHGTVKIIRECKILGLQEPSFTDEFSGLMVTFYNQYSSVKTSVKILELAAENRLITISELSEAIGVTERSIERNLKKLQDKGLIKRIGPAKGGHWEVID